MIYVMSDIHGNMRRFNSIMEQIDLQTSLLYDALTALLEKMRVYDVQEAQMLTERITAKPTLQAAAVLS